MIIFGDHTSKSLACSLALSLPLTHVTSPQFNATSTQRNSINHSIRLFAYSLTYWFRSSRISSLTHSSPRSKIHSLTQLFTPSRNNPIIHSLPYSFKYSRIIHFSIHSPNNKFIKANIFFIHCDHVYYIWRLIDKCLASVRPPHHCLLWGEPPVSD